jgi:hypothetical protein
MTHAKAKQPDSCTVLSHELNKKKVGYWFFIVTPTFLASTFTPFLSKVIVVPAFSGGSFTMITGVEGMIMTSFFAGLSEQAITDKITTRDKKLIVCFILKFLF